MNKLTMLIGFILVGTAAMAQTDFSGTWAQKNQDFITGPHYANAVPKQIKVNTTKDSMMVEMISLGQNGDDTTHFTLAKNGGTLSSVSKSNRKYTKKLEWSADKKVMTITTVYKAPGSDTQIESTRTENWSLSADGKQLLLDRKSVKPDNTNDWEAKGTYEK